VTGSNGDPVARRAFPLDHSLASGREREERRVVRSRAREENERRRRKRHTLGMNFAETSRVGERKDDRAVHVF